MWKMTGLNKLITSFEQAHLLTNNSNICMKLSPRRWARSSLVLQPLQKKVKAL